MKSPSWSLHVSEALGNGRVLTALAAANLQKIGQVPDLAAQGLPAFLEECDASQFVLGLGNRGVAALDVSGPSTLSAPVFASVPIALPAEGPNAGGTSVIFKYMNTLTFTTPALTSGAQQLILANRDSETVSFDAAFLAQ